MRFLSLGSGSRGNCALFDSGSARVLIDCGISLGRVKESLSALGLDVCDIDAVVLTHEHSDHIRYLKRFMSEYSIPVYASGGTLESLGTALKDDYFDTAGRGLMESVSALKAFNVGDIEILPFKIYHDSAEPLMYRLSAGNASVGILTDCGHYDDSIKEMLSDLDAMILEANHDPDMLVSGRYPDFLKRRILSGTGHLSNFDCAMLLSEVMSPMLKAVLLGHLSRENNTHSLALETVQSELLRAYRGSGAEVAIGIAPQDGMSKAIEL